eukprot:216263-Chlamydomonas_euryale.AAC.2
MQPFGTVVRCVEIRRWRVAIGFRVKGLGFIRSTRDTRHCRAPSKASCPPHGNPGPPGNRPPAGMRWPDGWLRPAAVSGKGSILPRLSARSQRRTAPRPSSWSPPHPHFQAQFRA